MTKALIMDVGAHLGEDTDFYLAKGFRVVAVEAYGPHVQKMRQRFAGQISCGDLVIEEICIAPTAGTGRLFVHESNSDWHRISKDTNHPSSAGLRETEVEYTDASCFLRRHEVPYYLKIDIEDMDWVLVLALDDTIKPAFVSFELHSRTDDCIDHLDALGFQSFQVVDQRHKGTAPPNPAREGCFVAKEFTGYMSGLFGFELADNWQASSSMKEAIRTLSWSDGQWYDLHASLFPHKGGTLTRPTD